MQLAMPHRCRMLENTYLAAAGPWAKRDQCCSLVGERLIFCLEKKSGLSHFSCKRSFIIHPLTHILSRSASGGKVARIQQILGRPTTLFVNSRPVGWEGTESPLSARLGFNILPFVKPWSSTSIMNRKRFLIIMI